MTAEGSSSTPFSLNDIASQLVASLVASAEILRIGVSRGASGELLIDAGAKALGGIEVGLRVAEICMGGLGTVQLSPEPRDGLWMIGVSTTNPVLACLASQYAGWSLSEGDYHVLGSGPGRAVAAKEELFAELKYQEKPQQAIFVLEASAPPPTPIVERVAKDCGLSPKDLVFIYAPTSSLAGSTQIVARVLEVALHKTHALKFPLDHVVDGVGAAPLAPPSPDFITAMGRTNDAIIFGGQVHLFVTGPEREAEELAKALPSRASKNFGKPFGQTFKEVNFDFYKIDPMLFSPAVVTVTALETGRSFRSGSIARALLEASFN